MADQPVTDPQILAQLEGGAPSATAGNQPVTDPKLLAQLETGSQDSGPRLGPVASSIVRPLAKGVGDIINFVPDFATATANLVPESVLGPKLQMPSEAWNNVIDKYTTKPGTMLGRVSEGASSMLVGGGLQGAAERGAGLVAQEAPRAFSRITTRAAQEAHSAGYRLPPSSIGGQVGRTVQTIAGGPKVEKEFSAANQAVTDRLASTELGLHPEHELEEHALEDLKTEAYQPYEEARNLGTVPTDPQFQMDLASAGGRFASRGSSFGGSRFPEIVTEKAPYQVDHFTASEAIDEIRMLRKLSRDNLRQYNPTANAMGYTQREIANALENQIQRVAQRSGNGTLIDRLKAARVQLSKIAAVEDSMGPGGHVRASDLKRLMDSGVPLTGNLRTIAQTAREFPKATQLLAEQGHAGGSGVFSAVDYLLGGTGLIEGSAGVAGLTLARPLSRWALRTGPVQNTMIRNMSRTGPSTLDQLGSAIARGAGLEVAEGDTLQ